MPVRARRREGREEGRERERERKRWRKEVEGETTRTEVIHLDGCCSEL